MSERTRFPRPHVQAACWAVAGALAAGLVALLLGVRWPTGLPLLQQIGLALVVPLASYSSVPIARSARSSEVPERVSLEDAGVVPLLVLLPAGSAWLVAMTSYVVLLVVVRRLPPVKVAFNAGQWAVTIGVAAALFHVLTGGAPRAITPAVVATTLVAITIHAAVNYAAVGFVIAAVSGLDFDDRAGIVRRLYPVMYGGNAALGLTVAALWLEAPWLSLLAWPLGLVLLQGYSNIVARDESSNETDIERDRLHLVLSRTPTATLLLDSDDTVAVWNPAMEELTGIPASAALGRDATLLLAGRLRHPGSRRELTLADVTLRDEAPHELLVQHDDGGERVVSVVQRHDTDRLGAPVGVLLLLDDLTAERDAARLKDDFLARVTHELRTPLTSIIGFGRTIQTHGAKLARDDHDRLVDRIVAAGEELERLVDDLLLVAADTHGSGRASDGLGPHGLTLLVDRAVSMELREHPGRRVDITERNEAVAIVDPSWFTTVVRNLVSNALRYSDPPAPVTVEVDADHEHGIVRVIDHGRGIPSGQLLRVFDRFTRVEDPLHMETRGAGLGLFIVDRLVGRMGGHVMVDSTLREGSTFEVRLPIAALDRPPMPVQTGAADGQG